MAIGRGAMAFSRGDKRVGLFAVLIFCLIPIHHAFGQLMTIDGPYVACWILASWAAWRVFDGLRSGRSTLPGWIALGLVLGIGFLFKYTILLLIPGLVAYAALDRRRLGWSGRATLGLVLSGVVFLAAISPVLVWNQQHGWPTVAELLGHLGWARDGRPAGDPRAYDPVWTLELIGSQVFVIGPPLLLMGWAVGSALRRRRRSLEDRSANRMMICFAAPILLFYFLLTFITDVEANWPVAGYATLVILAARFVVAELPRRRQAGPQRPPPGAEQGPAVPKKPRRRRFLFAWWCWTVAYGCIAAIGIFWPRVLAAAPVAGRYVPLHRIAGHRAWAAQVQSVIERARADGGEDPLVVADHYQPTALLAFYLPGRPVTRCASGLGGVRSAYDFFQDADLHDPRLVGRTFVLIAKNPQMWPCVFHFDRLEEAPAPEGVRLGIGFRGLVQ